jgi:hypothetical protein
VTGDVVAPRLLFIGGLHRSGTSLIHRCISRHPQVAGFHDTGVLEDEGQYLQSVYPLGQAYGGPGRFALDPRCHLTESSALVSRKTASACSHALRSLVDDAQPRPSPRSASGRAPRRGRAPVRVQRVGSRLYRTGYAALT